MNFILSADLHLNETEKEYSFSVLEEIITICIREKCGLLLFAGDVFDSRGDTEKLRDDFRAALEKLPSSCTVYFLPGNHEDLRAKGDEKLESFDFGRARLLSVKPYSLHELNTDSELLAIPFQTDYSGYRQWDVPPKTKALRIVLAHGTVPGIAYTGPSEETDGALDEDLFSYFKADIAALGHLHSQYLDRKGDVLIAYPGSARVWREGESGKRSVLLGNTDTRLLVPILLESAGEYHVIPVYVSPKGELRMNLPEHISQTDRLNLVFSGVVDDEPSVMNDLKKLKTELEKKCRRVEHDTKAINVLEGISMHPLAISFLKAWEDDASRYAKEEPGVYELARLQGLLVLKETLERRK